MTREEREKAIDALKISAPIMAVTQEEFNDYIQTLNKIMNWLEQEPCTDAISRQAALSHKVYTETEEGWSGYTVDADIIENLPPVTAEKVGHWEWVQYDGNPNIGNWHCSECRVIIPHMPEETDNTPIYRWCPYCGAKMSASPTEAEGSEE